MAVCMTHNVALFKIDVKTGKLIELLKFQADFATPDASANHCTLSYDNTLLATGGDDSTIRIFTLAKDFKAVEEKIEVKAATMAITCLDINRDNTVMVATSKDSFAYLIDLSHKQMGKIKPQVLQKLSFKNQPNAKSMMMRSCIIRRDNSVYTLAQMPQQPSYLILWSPQ